MLGIDDAVLVHMEIERVVGLLGVVRMPILRFLPADDLADVLNENFAFCNVLQRKDALAMHARTTGLDAASRRDGRDIRGCVAGHG